MTLNTDVILDSLRQLWNEPPTKIAAPITHVDCCDHGKTTLRNSRTACCNGSQFVPSGTVISRKVRMCINPEKRTAKTKRIA